MKLRNKKTGEIKDYCSVAIFVNASDDKTAGEYYTLKELNENWEDYKPAEPLITDKRIRKAVRAWTEANGIEFIEIASDSRLKDCGGNYIEFLCSPFKELPKKPYYIDDLCGEEEE